MKDDVELLKTFEGWLATKSKSYFEQLFPTQKLFRKIYSYFVLETHKSTFVGYRDNHREINNAINRYLHLIKYYKKGQQSYTTGYKLLKTQIKSQVGLLDE